MSAALNGANKLRLRRSAFIYYNFTFPNPYPLKIMKYSFDKLTDRRGVNSLKWNCGENELPMWVADMDFDNPPCIQQAVEERARRGIFGYTDVGDEWYSAICNWWKRRHGWNIQKDWLIFCTGVVPAITSMVKRLSEVGDDVVILTPVYDIFYHSVENTGRHVVESPLIYDGKSYNIDFADLEEKLARPNASLMILCNPHNPVGKIWSAEELKRAGDLCIKYGVKVISDEIHCDITRPGTSYVPFASLGKKYADICAVCLSATKAFNMAGLQSAAVAVPDPILKAKIERGLNSDEVAEPNCFAAIAAAAAFNGGEEWLDELRAYLWDNRRVAEEYISAHIPQLKAVEADATYLMWVDCSAVSADAQVLVDHIRANTGLWITAGNVYRGDGARFLRINLACPRSRLEDGLNRLMYGINSFQF